MPIPYVAPRNDEERVLADLWAQALRLERVGIVDNFFDLGGDSMVMTQIWPDPKRRSACRSRSGRSSTIRRCKRWRSGSTSSA